MRGFRHNGRRLRRQLAPSLRDSAQLPAIWNAHPRLRRVWSLQMSRRPLAEIFLFFLGYRLTLFYNKQILFL